MDRLKSEQNCHELLKHVRMPEQDRAKIYLPFDAVSGLREALAEVREEYAKYGQNENADA